ncbi:MAG: hypothetical protein KF910_10585 [Brevundimonas sp.]|uniref:DUF6173 family protein n=1 Tax=Brevundimonas sp. TaxID=1871086 RepID=UPI0025BA784D|nr:DUF6173 family protein [Brevundimonas sp.]MBX3478047.1 hypothetical protein [Brevundimonas sp.]
MTVISKTPPPVKADPTMFSGPPCPQPVVPDSAPEDAEAMAQGLRMRDNPAEWAFVRLSRMIEAFETGIDKDEEVAASIVGLPGDGTLRIEDVGFWGPDLIMFFGKNGDGKPVRLIQHYGQINVVLSVARKPEDRPARRIGFQLSELVEKTNPKA